MSKRSYYTTPLLVITTLISLGTFVRIQHFIQEQAYADSVYLNRSFEQYALAIHVFDRIQKAQQPSGEHISTPEQVRAIYISSWVAGTPSLRNDLIRFIKNSEINSVVIDIKDSTGVISFDIDNNLIDSLGTDSTRISDIEELLSELHHAGVYIIGRLTAFQDPLLSQKKPEWSFTRVDNGQTWKDRKGLAFINT
ncbi:hypothetical protein KC901_03180 [Patescibacteria group bacterium]|nr:hypothetical protein [Patescibacteria group bacterium]